MAPHPELQAIPWADAPAAAAARGPRGGVRHGQPAARLRRHRRDRHADAALGAGAPDDAEPAGGYRDRGAARLAPRRRLRGGLGPAARASSAACRATSCWSPARRARPTSSRRWNSARTARAGCTWCWWRTQRHNAAMPLWPLIATLAAQTLATMALFSLPAIAPGGRPALWRPGRIGRRCSSRWPTASASSRRCSRPGSSIATAASAPCRAVLVAAAAMLLLAAGGSVALARRRRRRAGPRLRRGGAGQHASAGAAHTGTRLQHGDVAAPDRRAAGRRARLAAAAAAGTASSAGARRCWPSFRPMLLLTVLLEIPRRRWDADTRAGATAVRARAAAAVRAAARGADAAACRSPASSIPARSSASSPS